MGEETDSATAPKLGAWAGFCFVALGSSLGDRGAPGDIDEVEMDEDPLGDLPYNELRSLDVLRPLSSPPAVDAVLTFGDVGEPEAPGIS